MQLSRRRLILSAGAAAAAAAVPPRSAAAVHLPPPVRPLRRALRPDVEAFLRAVEAGDLGEVRRRLRLDASLASAGDAQGRSAFVLAHLAGRTAVAEELRPRLELDIVEAALAEDWPRLAKLAADDPRRCNAAHAIGGTPLYAAALVGSLQLSRLRSAGCRSDEAPAGGSGFTPARAAMSCRTVSGALGAATDLLGNGADVRARQRGGDTVLHGAVRARSEMLVRLAIRKGADPAARDDGGRSAAELAAELQWDAGIRLLANHGALPRDHRASRWLFDGNRAPVVRPDLSDVPRDRQSAITGSSHAQFDRLRDLVGDEPRLVWSVSSDDELAIEACAHTGNRPIIRFHLDRGAPLSLPTAVALGDREAIRFLLERDPRLVHERGAHDFPVMWYAVLGGGGPELGELLRGYGVSPDQESLGTTALHWCVKLDARDFAAWLIERGADLEAHGYKWDRNGQTPLELARVDQRKEMAALLEQAGARR